MVTEEGASVGEAPGRNAGAFVQALLDLRDTYNRFLLESFSSDQHFKNSIASVSPTSTAALDIAYVVHTVLIYTYTDSS